MDQITINKSACMSTISETGANRYSGTISRPLQQTPTIKRYFSFTLLIKICALAWTLVDLFVIASHHVEDDYDNYYALRWEHFKRIMIPKYSCVVTLELIGLVSGWIAYFADHKMSLIIHTLASILAFVIEIGSLFILPVIRGWIKLFDAVFIIIAIKFYQHLRVDTKVEAERDLIGMKKAHINQAANRTSVTQF